VGITASCDVNSSLVSMLVGVVSGSVFFFSSRLLKYLHIDDPLDAFSVHGANGLVGVMVSGLVRGDWQIFIGCCIGALFIIV